ncbi:MAG: 23S rRNA (pseudouridine(1915)-N(3))-methyltransferase RlmH [Rickettsiales bacterium]
MNINIISISNKLDKNIESLISHYTKQLDTKIRFINIKSQNLRESKKTRIAHEANLISEKVKPGSYAVCLDKSGNLLSSEEFADMLFSKPNNDMSFIIGGAYGLASQILDKSNSAVSFGHMTLPHQIAKLLLVEQIYRAQQIKKNHPYHK